MDTKVAVTLIAFDMKFVVQLNTLKEVYLCTKFRNIKILFQFLPINLDIYNMDTKVAVTLIAFDLKYNCTVEHFEKVELY